MDLHHQSPSALVYADGFAVNGYMYLFGGRTADGTYVAPVHLLSSISANTTIAGITRRCRRLVHKPISDTPVTAVLRPPTMTERRMYSAAGATLLYLRIARVTLNNPRLVATPVAKHYYDRHRFRRIPKRLVFNGLDNSTGARWQLKYCSMANQQVASLCATNDYLGPEINFWRRCTGYTWCLHRQRRQWHQYKMWPLLLQCKRTALAFGYPDDVRADRLITDLTLSIYCRPR